LSRLAKCSCGSLRLSAEGQPQAVVACHCIDCQRRTGSVFGVGAYYPKEQVQISGEARSFVRPTDAGHEFTTNFCPNCGSSVYWASGKNPGLIGVAVGAFADRSFPAPVRSVWEQSMHPWATVSVASQHFVKGRVS
jgi:hypothetical protein